MLNLETFPWWLQTGLQNKQNRNKQDSGAIPPPCCGLYMGRGEGVDGSEVLGFWDFWEIFRLYSNRPTVRSKWVPRDDFRDNFVLSEQIYPSAKPFWDSDRRKAPIGGRDRPSSGGPFLPFWLNSKNELLHKRYNLLLR